MERMEDNWTQVVDENCSCLDDPRNYNTSTTDGAFYPRESCVIHGRNPVPIEELGYRQWQS